MSKGFTITELLVSIGIISILFTAIVGSQSSYTEGIALSNLADDISLSISQAQSYGSGVREAAPGDFSRAYGLSFSLLSSGSPLAYIYFVDRNGNKIYDGDWLCPESSGSECVTKTDILRGNQISGLCVVRIGDSDICDISRIDISFSRPKTEPQLTFFDSSGQSVSIANTIGAKIMLSSLSNATSSVTAYQTGQITVQ